MIQHESILIQLLVAKVSFHLQQGTYSKDSSKHSDTALVIYSTYQAKKGSAKPNSPHACMQPNPSCSIVKHELNFVLNFPPILYLAAANPRVVTRERETFGSLAAFKGPIQERQKETKEVLSRYCSPEQTKQRPSYLYAFGFENLSCIRGRKLEIVRF